VRNGIEMLVVATGISMASLAERQFSSLRNERPPYCYLRSKVATSRSDACRTIESGDPKNTGVGVEILFLSDLQPEIAWRETNPPVTEDMGETPLPKNCYPLISVLQLVMKQEMHNLVE
jgi:hypothetical protein